MQPTLRRPFGRHDTIRAVVLLALLGAGLLAWGAGTTLAAPAVDELLFVSVTDPEQQLEALLAGEGHILPLHDPTVGSERWERLAADPRVELLAAPSYRLFHLGFNLRRWPFSDGRFRRALARGIDREAIAAAAFGPYGMPARGYVPEYDPFFEASPADARIAFDPEAAAALLEEAGFTLEEGGVRLDPRTKRPLTPQVVLAPLEQEAGPAHRAALAIAEAARRLGIPMELEALPWPVLHERIARTDFHAYALSWWIPRHPGYLYALFHSSQDVLGGFNTVGIRRMALDRTLEALRFARDAGEAEQATRHVQQILYREVPFIPLFYSPTLTAVRSDRVAGLTAMPRYGAADYRHRRAALQLTPVPRPGPEDLDHEQSTVDHGDAEPIRWILPREPRSLNPFTAVDTADWEILGRIYEPLWALDSETLEPAPWLATHWTVESEENNEGGCRLTFILRDDVTWHDGTPFTSADVKFTFEQAKANRLLGWAGELVQLVEVEAPDPHRVVFHFSTPGYWHLYRLDVPILPRHVWEGVEDPGAINPLSDGEGVALGAPSATVAPGPWLVGTGPFTFTGRTEAGAYLLHRYEAYAQPESHRDDVDSVTEEGDTEDGTSAPDLGDESEGPLVEAISSTPPGSNSPRAGTVSG